MVLVIMLFCNTKTNPEVKKSVLAGTWYTDNPAKLAAEIDGYLSKAEAKSGVTRPLIVIQPHAGYVYSGNVAAAGYRILKNYSPDVIVIIAPSHHEYFNGCSLLKVDYYETPLGRVKVDKEAADALLKNNLFRNNAGAFSREHAVEIQIPFLQRIYGKRLENELPIIPVIAGEIGSQDAPEIANALAMAVKNRKAPLFIISSDFTHYGPRFGYQPFKSSNKDILKKKLSELDLGAVDKIIKKDFKGYCDYIDKTGATICGRNPIKIALSLPVENYKAELISYDTSGNITGDYENTVSYVSLIISGDLSKSAENKKSKFGISEDDKKFLLKLARDNLTSLLNNKGNIAIDGKNVPENCRYRTGVFVTLKENGELRGCIGYIIGMKPLYEEVIENSYNAAFKDPRFPPVEKPELKNIKIEISVLTVPEPVKSVDEIAVGRDGLIIEKGFYRGLLLPQVPVELGWDRDTFLIHLCRKAGLPDDAWKQGAKISKFEAIVFGEQ
jgi:hypothetical protein